MENFLNELSKDSCFFDELFQENTNIEYMRHLYYMLSQVRDRERQYIYSTRSWSAAMKKKEALHEVKFILCKDGNLHCASEGLFFETDYKPMYIRNPIYVDLGKGNKERTESLRDFFILLGVQDMTIQLDTMSEIENTTDSDSVIRWFESSYPSQKGQIWAKTGSDLLFFCILAEKDAVFECSMLGIGK